MTLKTNLKQMMPTILFGVGVVGVFVSEVVVSIDTIKAEKVIKEKDIHLKVAVEQTEELAPGVLSTTGYELVNRPLKEFIQEVIKATWKCYIPTFVATSLTVTSLVMSKHLTSKQIAALSAAVASTGSLVTRYRQEIRDRLDADTLKEIDKDIAKEEIIKAKPAVINTSHLVNGESFDLSDDGNKEYLFFDPFTGMKFMTTKLAACGARYYLNRNFALGGAAPLSMFYGFLGLELPDEYKSAGWDANEMTEQCMYWCDIDFVRSDDVDPETGDPYYIIEYDNLSDKLDDYTYPFGNPVDIEGSHVNA